MVTLLILLVVGICLYFCRTCRKLRHLRHKIKYILNILYEDVSIQLWHRKYSNAKVGSYAYPAWRLYTNGAVKKIMVLNHLDTIMFIESIRQLPRRERWQKLHWWHVYQFALRLIQEDAEKRRQQTIEEHYAEMEAEIMAIVERCERRESETETVDSAMPPAAAIDISKTSTARCYTMNDLLAEIEDADERAAVEAFLQQNPSIQEAALRKDLTVQLRRNAAGEIYAGPIMKVSV